MLPPRLEEDHRGRVRQVQTAVAGLHGQTQTPLGGEGLEQVRRQAAGLGPQQKAVSRPIGRRVMADPAMGAEGEDAGLRKAGEAVGQARVHPHVGPFAVVEPGAPQTPVLQAEAKGFDQVQGRADVGAQAHDIAGVRRDFRLVKNKMEHC